MRRRNLVQYVEGSSQMTLARGASSLGASSVGAFAAGAAAAGAVAIGALAIRSLAIKRAKIQRLSIDELDVRRLRVEELIVEEERSAPHPFAYLEKSSYINLTTFRKSGEPVSTPLWFALYGGRLYATTEPDSGKMKRIRNNPSVLMAPCNAWGKEQGARVEGLARQLDDGEAPEAATQAFHRKYRLGLGLFHLFGQRQIGKITLEVEPVREGEVVEERND